MKTTKIQGEQIKGLYVTQITEDGDLAVLSGSNQFSVSDKREFSKLIGFLVVALIAVGLVFNAGGVKDVLLELFNKIIGA